jgi:hypothetical protein
MARSDALRLALTKNCSRTQAWALENIERGAKPLAKALDRGDGVGGEVLSCQGLSSLPPIPPHRRALALDQCRSVAQPLDVDGCPDLERLHVKDASHALASMPLAGLPALKSLQLALSTYPADAPGSAAVFAVGQSPGLENLTLDFANQVPNFEGLETLSQLKKFSLVGCQGVLQSESLQGLSGCGSLVEVNLEGCRMERLPRALTQLGSQCTVKLSAPLLGAQALAQARAAAPKDPAQGPRFVVGDTVPQHALPVAELEAEVSRWCVQAGVPVKPIPRVHETLLNRSASERFSRFLLQLARQPIGQHPQTATRAAALIDEFLGSASLMRFCFLGKPTYSDSGPIFEPETPELLEKRSTLDGVEQLAEKFKRDALAADHPTF